MKLKNIISKSIATTTATIITTLPAIAADDSSSNLTFKPYVGVAAMYRNGGYKQDFGNRQLKKNQPVADVFAGAMLHENIGFEIGYERTFKNNKTTNTPANTTAFGRTPIVPVQYKTKATIKGPHLAVIGKYAITSTISGFAKFGFKYATAKISETPTIFTPGATQFSPIQFNRNKSKLIPKITLGLEYSLTKNIAGRFIYSFEKINKLQPSGLNAANDTNKAKMKNSNSYGLGIVYYI